MGQGSPYYSSLIFFKFLCRVGSTDRVIGTGNPWAGQVREIVLDDNVGGKTLMSALRNFGLALVTGSGNGRNKWIFDERLYLNAGTGYPCAGQTSVATSSMWTITSSVLTDTPENFGFTLAIGSNCPNNSTLIQPFFEVDQRITWMLARDIPELDTKASWIYWGGQLDSLTWHPEQLIWVLYSIPALQNKTKSVTYLEIGTGYACAGHWSVTPRPSMTSNVLLLSIVGNFGLANPTGSRDKT